MSYEPTNWKSGDKVTSTRLNKIEQGIQGNDAGLSTLMEGLSDVLSRSNNAASIALENGNIDLSGKNVDATNRARTLNAFNDSFILKLSNGYNIANVMKYNYDVNGNPTFIGYNTLNSNIVVFMAGYYMNGAGGFGIKADAYRLSFKRTNNEVISEADIDGIVSEYIPVTTNGIVRLTGMGTSGSQAGVQSVGDIYYNTSSKLLRVLVDGAIYFTVPYAKNTLYVIGTIVYAWDGNDLVRTDADVLSDISDMMENVDASQDEADVFMNDIISKKELIFVQGGISLRGQNDDSATAMRIRTGYINMYSVLSFSVSDAYEARIALYDKGGNFISLTDYNTSFKNIDNVNNLVRFLVRHKDNSNILASEMTSETYSLTASKDIYTDVVPMRYIEPLFGSTSLYTSSALEHTEIDSKTSAELFREYDGLVTQYPKFFKRAEDIGLDAYGNSIRAYTLGFTSSAVYESESGTVNVWDDSYNYRTILITSGVHGGEKTASWGLMLAIKEILESSEDWASFIKSNLIIKIIPCVNIWGFDNNSRLNYKDINVNRDAYTWASEEGQALKGWYDSNLNAIYYMDIHGTSGGRGYQEIWNLSPYKRLHCQNCAKLGGALYNNWVVKFGRYPTFPAIISSFTGLLVSYLEAQNIPASIIEIPRDIVSGGSENYLDACAFAKDIIINMIQACGQTPIRAFPIMN